MSLRSSGFWCDVCNGVMLKEVILGESIQSFKISCSPTPLHAHDECMKLIEPACKAQDETMLPPDSPLGDIIRRVKIHNAQIAAQEGK